MSRVVGVICEYNPFHKGHKYQIDRIKSDLPNAIIVAIMSGNIVQRGEFSIISKQDRTRIALECGANVVVELPYPYSGSTAEIFANAGVEIASKLGCDTIYFGIEQLTVAQLEEIAQIIDSPEFETVLKQEIENKEISYILAKERALKKLGVEPSKCANDMLGVEYIRAIKNKGLNLEYCAIQRVGSFYNDDSVNAMMSASGIRKALYEEGSFTSVPDEVTSIYDEIIKDKRYLNVKFANDFLHSYILLNGNELSKSFDTSPEMASLINDCARNSGDFFANLSSKAFTTARLKRAILYALFGVKGVDFTPQFTFLLGMDKTGRAHLNRIKKETKFAIITKHSDSKKMTKRTKNLLETTYLVDAFYNTLLVNAEVPVNAYKNKPIIKK